jgi:hypothetical protein
MLQHSASSARDGLRAQRFVIFFAGITAGPKAPFSDVSRVFPVIGDNTPFRNPVRPESGKAQVTRDQGGTLLHLEVRTDSTVYERVRSVCEGKPPERRIRALVSAVSALPAFGSEAEFITREPNAWFALGSMGDSDFWNGQQRLLRYIETELSASIDTIKPYLPRVTGHRAVPVVVHPVPGLTTCYGAPEGGQLFGLYEGADPREMLLFLSHTYYHELSTALDTESSRQAAADPGTPGRFRHWLLLLIRNEGIANYAVLEQLRALRQEGVAFKYFKYAGLIDNPSATARAMFACQELLRMLDQRTVRQVAARVSAVLKNPRLPVINLIGIHMAEAIARRFGERALLDVDRREPQEFFRLYAESEDELGEQLLGPPGGDGHAVFGLPIVESSRQRS